MRQYSAHIVIVHYNNPFKLLRTIRTFKERKKSWVRFFLIDNSSNNLHFLIAFLVLFFLIKRYIVIRRENKNKDAGGYWHYLQLIKEDQADIIVFTQDEIHQRGMRPKRAGGGLVKKIGKLLDRDLSIKKKYELVIGKIFSNTPYYPDYYGKNGISLLTCLQWLQDNPLDQIGFGGRRYRAQIDYDDRFYPGYWHERWKQYNLAWYDFFSGACFAIGPTIVDYYISLASPTPEDLENAYFAWMWERMWGTIPLLVGGKLVHYNGFVSNRVEEYSPRNLENPEFKGKSVPIEFDDSLTVADSASTFSSDQ